MNRPKAIEHWSPNFTPKDPGREVSCVVLHATAGARDGALVTLCDPRPDNPILRVSAHYLIDRLGATYKLVDEQNVAWHAGESLWAGRDHVNNFSVGIELENSNSGADLYPNQQVLACAELVAAICLEHGIRSSNVVGHADIAPGRKTDPAGFPFETFRNVLQATGVLP